MSIFKSRRSRESRTAHPVLPAAAEIRGSVLLTPGPHTIDGKLVDVPHNDTQDRVWYPLPPGRHLIDGKVAIVPDLQPGKFSLMLHDDKH